MPGAAVPDLLDINMGCPVRKVMRTGAGAALLGEPERAVAVAAAVVEAAERAWCPGHRQAAQRAAARARGPRWSWRRAWRRWGWPRSASIPGPPASTTAAPADHTVTAEVVRAVGIPVIASGDVMSVSVGQARSSGSHGSDGSHGGARSSGRSLAGRRASRRARTTPRPPLPEVIADLRALLALAIEEMGPERALKWMWRLVGWYLRPSRVAPATIERAAARRGRRRARRGARPRWCGRLSIVLTSVFLHHIMPRSP